MQILIGRRDNPHINFQVVLSADALKLALLQDTQQLDLHRRRNLPNLIQKKRPSIRLLEFPFFLAYRSGKCSALVPEELGLKQCFHQRSTIYSEKPCIAPSTGLMDQAGSHFFACPSLTGQQGGRIGSRDDANLIEEILKRAAFADHSAGFGQAVEFLPKMGVFLDERLIAHDNPERSALSRL